MRALLVVCLLLSGCGNRHPMGDTEESQSWISAPGDLYIGLMKDLDPACSQEVSSDGTGYRRQHYFLKHMQGLPVYVKFDKPLKNWGNLKGACAFTEAEGGTLVAVSKFTTAKQVDAGDGGPELNWTLP
jgi:hypothetical protein